MQPTMMHYESACEDKAIKGEGSLIDSTTNRIDALILKLKLEAKARGASRTKEPD